MDKNNETGGEGFGGARPVSISDDILTLLEKNTKNPGEAFVLLQELTIYVWDQYKVDWNSSKSHEVAATRRQRYLDYVTQLLDNLKAKQLLTQEID